MKFTQEQAEENGKAVAAFLQGKSIEARMEKFHPWTPCLNIMGVDQYYLRVKPAPAHPERWSRMEHVPLPCWLQQKGSTQVWSIARLNNEGIGTDRAFLVWGELADHLYTTGERDASGALIFHECEVRK